MSSSSSTLNVFPLKWLATNRTFMEIPNWWALDLRNNTSHSPRMAKLLNWMLLVLLWGFSISLKNFSNLQWGQIARWSVLERELNLRWMMKNTFKNWKRRWTTPKVWNHRTVYPIFRNQIWINSIKKLTLIGYIRNKTKTKGTIRSWITSHRLWWINLRGMQWGQQLVSVCNNLQDLVCKPQWLFHQWDNNRLLITAATLIKICLEVRDKENTAANKTPEEGTTNHHRICLSITKTKSPEAPLFPAH